MASIMPAVVYLGTRRAGRAVRALGRELRDRKPDVVISAPAQVNLLGLRFSEERVLD